LNFVTTSEDTTASYERADNLFEFVSFLQRREGVRLEIKASPALETRRARVRMAALERYLL
jgi:hypothetical protein